MSKLSNTRHQFFLIFYAILATLSLSIPAIAGSTLFTDNARPEANLQSDAAQTQPNAINVTELLVFDENRAVTLADRGFPRDDPPRSSANGNWKSPINYAEGTLYFRVQIRSQPRPQDMRIQFCMWQYNFTLETCGSKAVVSGASGTVVTWSQKIQDMWKLNGNPMDWVNPRQRYGAAIKNSAGDPVSNYNGWNWNGENPNHWYPLDMRFTVVVVAKDETFSGWSNYGGSGGGGQPTPTSTPNPTSAPTSAPTVTPTNTSSPGETPTNGGNVLANGGFENGTSSWSFYSANGGAFSAGSPAYSGSNGAKVTIAQANNNVQLYQHGLQLKANTSYKFSFWGYSNSGHDLNVYLHKHQSPHTFYGLSQKINMGTGWNKHEVEFTTQGFNGTISDARLRFWLSSYGTAGDVYYFDEVQLEEVNGSGGPAPTPTNTPTPDLSGPPPSGGGGGTGGSNQLGNGSFENGTSFWSYHTGGQGAMDLVNSTIDGTKAARIAVTQADNNIQLYQKGLTLKANSNYRLSFYAYSSTGHDLEVYLHKHTAPYTDYGLRKKIQLDQAWKQYIIEFSTAGFSGAVSDARLRLWLANNAAAGDQYFLDGLVLSELTGTSTQITGLGYSLQPLDVSISDEEASLFIIDDAEIDSMDITDLAAGTTDGEDIQVADEDTRDTSTEANDIFLPFTSN